MPPSAAKRDPEMHISQASICDAYMPFLQYSVAQVVSQPPAPPSPQSQAWMIDTSLLMPAV